MAVVFFIVLFLILCIIVIVSSTIKIRIQKLNFNNETSKILYDYCFYIELYFLGKIKIFTSTFNPKKVEKLNNKINVKEKFRNVNLKKMKKDLSSKKELKQILKKMNIKLEKFHLMLEIGTEDVIFTAGIVTVVSSTLGIILSRLIKKYDEQAYSYKIIPIYKNKNMVNLSLDCIIQVKMIHIISIIYTLLKKRKEKVRNERTSNRRSYDYSYEQY